MDEEVYVWIGSHLETGRRNSVYMAVVGYLPFKKEDD